MQVLNSKRVVQQRALRLAHVQEFNGVLSSDQEEAVAKKPALLQSDETHEQCRGGGDGQENLRGTRECAVSVLR